MLAGRWLHDMVTKTSTMVADQSLAGKPQPVAANEDRNSKNVFYYCYPGLWEAFFHALGMEVVVSPVTSLKTIERASLISEANTACP